MNSSHDRPEAGSPLAISVVGLGYVGLPLAVALARHFPVTGYDNSTKRVSELRDGIDRTNEVSSETLRASRLRITGDDREIAESAVFIVTVPTPVDSANQPDLGAVLGACKAVGSRLGKGAIVVFESTVYPGVTEEICGPALEAASGLAAGRDFYLGYSPERINPGDREHTIERITKVIAGQTPAVVETLRKVYGALTNGNVFVARDIKTAEAAKVIENAQRDINVAFINEVTMIFQKLGLSVHDVLDAAGTKWNFLRFTPGLVGGHCIGVDPFYLAHRATEIGHHPEVILAGRQINDSMGAFVAQCIDARVKRKARILVLGLAFKENVPDIRNTKVVDIVNGLKKAGHDVVVHDPLADPIEANQHYGIIPQRTLDGLGEFDAVVGAVAHSDYRAFSAAALERLLTPDGLVADVKAIWRGLDLAKGIRRWEL
ncbi:MAG TPA: nucleotide sugar dehydrogenase [Stellaceae bacterium]|nr:nucleotide sugar dehydrogenase [Stellaceae bacterium]